MPFNLKGSENLGKAFVLMKEFDAVHLDERICEMKALQLFCNLDFAVCQNCNHHQTLKDEVKRMYRCEMCSKEIWITGGTFFDHVRKFRPYLAIFYLLENGIILSACDFAKLLSVATSTADRICKKVAILVSENMKSSKIEISTAELAAATMRRTCQTPAKQVALAEEQEIQRLLALRDTKESERQSDYPDHSPHEKLVQTHLTETPIKFADLCTKLNFDSAEASAALMGLELRGLALRLPGERYVISDQPRSQSAKATGANQRKSKHHKMTARLLDFIFERYQGVGRKNHQLFSALFWIQEDRKRWGPDSIRQLCAQSRHIPYHEILTFITPPTVKIFSCA